MRNAFTISDRVIGENQSCFLIAEVAQSHDGSLGIAHSFIDAAADAGADAIKFQTHIADAESTVEEKFRINFSYEDETRYQYWKRMEFSKEQWHGLYNHARQRGIIFLSSVFSQDAVRLMESIGMPAWKIGSGEFGNSLLLSEIAKTGKPILLSVGMSDWEEIERTVDKIQESESPMAILQCTSKYPTPLTEVGLNVLEELYLRFNVPIGLSDHSGSIFPSLAAMFSGVSIIEVHVTFHSVMFGPDVSVSLTFDELKLLADARDAFHLMKSNPVDKDKMALELSFMRELFNKSVALRTDQKKSTLLTENMLTLKKPGIGIPAKEMHKCIGKTLKRDVSSDLLLKWDDIE